MNKNCEITIKFTGWRTEDIILKLAEYVKDGFRIGSSSYEMSCHEGTVTTFELYKWK